MGRPDQRIWSIGLSWPIVHVNGMFVLRDLTPARTAITRIPNQSLVTNWTPAGEVNCFARGILRTDQQHEQRENYRDRRSR